jgi:two-component system sensor histidine kinase/response regulator
LASCASPRKLFFPSSTTSWISRKIEAGKLELEIIPFNLRESIHETMKALSFRAHQKNLELVYEVAPEVQEALLGDPGRIRQVLINLIGNAIKFTERGEVFISVEDQSQDPAITMLHFTVKDTGLGIPADKLHSIFAPFSQVDGSMSRRFGGTGLGLTICARLVEMMGGKIWAKSELGVGSTFHFTIRVAVQSSPSPRLAPLPPQRLRGVHVLIVDDNSTNRRILLTMLTRWGVLPTAVDGGPAALQALELASNMGSPFPLVLLDGHMPGMDGFTLASNIRQNPSFARTTLVMLTSSGQLGEAARCRELNISAYLVKPVRQSELLDAICQVLQYGTAEGPAPLVTRHSLREAKNSRTILLAEDNLVNLTLATKLLQKRGYTVITAPDGREALTMLEQHSPDLVLMDIQMPEMDGFEATAAIRSKEVTTGGHIPIVAMTAHAFKEDEERCLKAGMDAYISKPIRIAELVATIERLLSPLTNPRSSTTSDHPAPSPLPTR